MKISFYNTFSYGDIIFTRSLVNWVCKHLPSEHQIYYYHIKTINSIPLDPRVIEKPYTMEIHNKIYGFTNQANIKHCSLSFGELFINSMLFASKLFNQKNNNDVFCPKNMNTDSVRLKSIEVIQFLNMNLKIKIPIPTELDLLPNRTTICKNKTLIDEKFIDDKYKKTVLICNGDTFSGQSDNVDLYAIYKNVIEQNSDCLFVFTENKQNIYENAIFVPEFCPDNTIGDIEYISKYADILIGRSSGPSHTYFNVENCYSEPKTIIELTNDEGRAFFHKKGDAKYIWSDDFSIENLSTMLSSLLV
jgi:hypothetical protein